VIIAKDEETIRKHIKTAGSLNTALTALKQKKPVLIAIPDGNAEDTKIILGVLNEQETRIHESKRRAGYDEVQQSLRQSHKLL